MSEVAIYDRILCLKGAIALMDQIPWIKGQMHGTTPSGRRGCCAQGYIDWAAVAVYSDSSYRSSELFDAVVEDISQNLPDIYKQMEFAGLSTYNDTAGREKQEIRHLFYRTLEVLTTRMELHGNRPIPEILVR